MKIILFRAKAPAFPCYRVINIIDDFGDFKVLCHF